MPMLASDLMNPLFVGARNPDELMAVEFYWGTVKDRNHRPVIEKGGKEKKIPYVRISIPGNDTSTVDTPVREEHKRRFRRQWEFWQAQEQGEQLADAGGWRLEDWTELNDEQRRELKFLRFTVVEQLAQASDSTLQRVGVNGMALRLKARKALALRSEEAQAREIAVRDKQIAELQASMAAIQAQLAGLTQPQTPTPIEKAAEPEAPAAPRRGRPPKVKEEAS